MSNHQNTLQQTQALLNTVQPAALGPEPRSSREAFQMLEEKLRQIFSESEIPVPTQDLVRSLVLLWHDYLDESHSISQGITSADGSFLHGIMHRREPDYGNAKYWFHRVGKHATFPSIAARTATLLEKSGSANLTGKFIHHGAWDPIAFVDACEEALARRDEETIRHLQLIQQLEFQSLLEHFLR